jgi:alpha-beta hydrolase superfamily lysophospholipase
MHIEVLGELATKIKKGQYTHGIGVPSKLVLVGHSMGSAYINGLLAEAPKIADAAILTGLAFTRDTGTVLEAFNMRIAAKQNHVWSELDEGYTTWGSIYNNVNT